MSWHTAPHREARFWQPQLDVTRQPDGTLYLRQLAPLPAYPARVTDEILRRAALHPDRPAFADRKGPDGAWRHITYGRIARDMQHLGAWLLEQGLSAERPLLIMSGNDIEHATLALAAMHAGVPHAAIAPNYALLGGDYMRLREVVEQITPGLAFADSAAPYRPALAEVAPGITLLTPCGAGDHDWAAALAHPLTPALEKAHAAITPDTVAKFLFTSGSTGRPKAVINTHRMISASAMSTTSVDAFMLDEPPVVLCWAPWNHTAGGNSVFYMCLFSGGTLYIDDGRPTPEGIGRTIRNLREVSPHWYFNVPVGWDMLIPALRADAALRESLFRNLKMAWYAGASLTQSCWDALEELSVQTTGTRVVIATGLGATETSPSGFMCTWHQTSAGNIGLPTPGSTVKLVPIAGDPDKYDCRIKAPYVTPGYWRDPVNTAKAFDDEGYYCFGDAVTPVDPADLMKGFRFAGRTAENFKLDTGTWVATGALRLSLLEALGPSVLDVVITAPDRPWLGALVFLKDPAKATDARLQADLLARLQAHAAAQGGSSTRVRRLLLLDTPPDLRKGEMTDKGSINQRGVLANRPAAVEALYAGGANTLDIARSAA